MIERKSYVLDTDEIKEAIIEYLNDKGKGQFHVEDIESFSINKDNDDIRVYRCYIGMKEGE